MTLLLTPTAETVLARTFARAMTRAGEALGEMSGRQVAVDTPDVRLCGAAEVLDLAGGPGAIVVAVYLGITGALSGHAVLLLPPAGARRLAQILLDGLVEPATTPPVTDDGVLVLDELEVSALQEVGNVTLGTFLNEIGRHLEEPVQPTVPQAIVELAGAVLDAVLVDLMGDTESDEFLAARTAFREGDEQIEGTLLVLPRPASLATLVEALGAVDR